MAFARSVFLCLVAFYWVAPAKAKVVSVPELKSCYSVYTQRTELLEVGTQFERPVRIRAVCADGICRSMSFIEHNLKILIDQIGIANIKLSYRGLKVVDPEEALYGQDYVISMIDSAEDLQVNYFGNLMHVWQQQKQAGDKTARHVFYVRNAPEESDLGPTIDSLWYEEFIRFVIEDQARIGNHLIRYE